MNHYSAIVFGGTRGVGLEITKMFHQKNIPVVFTGTKHNKVKELEKKFDSRLVYGTELDLGCPFSIEKFKKKMKSIEYHPNILIYNAGYLSLRPIEKDENVKKLFQINSISPIVLTNFFLPSIKKYKYGHILFNSPPYIIDDKVKFLTPYIQSKLAQTTYMKSLAHILRNESISCNSMWTDYPLWTDAIKLRNVGTIENCVDPSILSRVVEEVVWNENPNTFKGNELIDEYYLKKKGIDTTIYFLGNNVRKLDELFLSHLKKK